MTYKGHVENGTIVFDEPMDLPEGAAVQIELAFLDSHPEKSSPESKSALDIIASLQEHRIFDSPKEVDEYVQKERESWNR